MQERDDYFNNFFVSNSSKSMDYLKRWTGKQNMWENNVVAENVF